MAGEIKQRIAFKAVITNNKNEVLILREANTYKDGNNIGKYHFPGGRLDPGEAWQEGLNREVIEETGLEVEIGKPLYVGEWRPVIQEVPHQIVAVFMVCMAKNTDSIKLSDEHDNFEWVNANSWKKFEVMVPDDDVLMTYFSQENK